MMNENDILIAHMNNLARKAVKTGFVASYNSPRELRRGIAAYICDYNDRRPHQSLDYNTPEGVYMGNSVY